MVVATFPEIAIVDVRCGGGHLHQQIRGSVKTEEGRWKNRAALSAAYPEKLGLAWGLAVSLACARLSRKAVASAGVRTAELPPGGSPVACCKDGVAVVSASPGGLRLRQ